MRRLFLSLSLFGGMTALSLSGVSAADAPKRFDEAVRVDLFSGFSGDDASLARGLKTCEDALKVDPKNAEALVWRGAARVYSAGQAFQNRNPLEGMKLWTSGLKDMDDAVALEPKSVGVRIPRASVLMPAARNAPPAMGKPLLKKALEDFSLIYEMQKAKGDLEKLGQHPRGELRMGLADVYRLTGEADKSKEQLEAILKELPDTKYSKRATEWLAAKPEAKLEHNCIGCHKH